MRQGKKRLLSVDALRGLGGGLHGRCRQSRRYHERVQCVDPCPVAWLDGCRFHLSDVPLSGRRFGGPGGAARHPVMPRSSHLAPRPKARRHPDPARPRGERLPQFQPGNTENSWRLAAHCRCVPGGALVASAFWHQGLDRDDRGYSRGLLAGCGAFVPGAWAGHPQPGFRIQSRELAGSDAHARPYMGIRYPPGTRKAS